LIQNRNVRVFEYGKLASAVVRLQPGYHTHQCALAASVDPDEANVILLEHIKRDIRK
jgi:hypothetical protein